MTHFRHKETSLKPIVNSESIGKLPNRDKVLFISLFRNWRLCFFVLIYFLLGWFCLVLLDFLVFVSLCRAYSA